MVPCFLGEGLGATIPKGGCALGDFPKGGLCSPEGRLCSAVRAGFLTESAGEAIINLSDSSKYMGPILLAAQTGNLDLIVNV